jgi:hypothetical protein
MDRHTLRRNLFAYEGRIYARLLLVVAFAVLFHAGALLLEQETARANNYRGRYRDRPGQFVLRVQGLVCGRHGVC